MNRFKIYPTKITGLVSIERKPISDSRGYLERLFCQESLWELLQGKSISQINHTTTHREGTVRGLHFQYPPNSESKVITCLRGRVWDVAVDLRRGSETFLQYQALLLTEDNFRSYIIPEGFAHGFQTCSPNCEMLYLHTSEYAPEFEGAVNALDPRLAVEWPELITERSEKDVKHPNLPNDFKGIVT